jgi:hypothetical protein
VKKIFVFFVLLVMMVAISSFAQDAQAQENPTQTELQTEGSKLPLPDGVKEIQKSDFPDLSKLHLSTSWFFVVRGDDVKWIKEGQLGDIAMPPLLRSDSYSKDADSTDIVAMALYAVGKKEPIAYFWDNNGTGTVALVLENGKIISAKGIAFAKITDEQNRVQGVMVVLTNRGNPITGREVLLKKENEKNESNK